MSQESIIRIARVSDKSIVGSFQEIFSTNKFSQSRVLMLGEIIVSKSNIDNVDEGSELARIIAEDGYLIRSIIISLETFTVRYYRGCKSGNSNVLDEIEFIEANANSAVSVGVVKYLVKKYSPILFDEAVDFKSADELQKLGAVHTTVLSRLEETNLKLLSETQAYRERLDNQYSEKQAELDEFHRERLDRLKVESEEKDLNFEARERDIQDRLKQIDDRNNTHARRETRERMLKDVKDRVEKFDLSEETRKKRMPVMAGIIAMCLAFVFVAITSWVEIGNESRMLLDKEVGDKLQALLQEKKAGEASTQSGGKTVPAVLSSIQLDRTHLYMLWVRFALSFSGLIATILFYIKWENGWANKHVESEFNLQQFYIDVNRASWVIESCLEWRKETQSAIPADLLKSITRNLFSDHQSEPEAIIHPADALASALLGSASNLKLNVAGNEIEFAKPGKIKNKPTVVSGEGG